MTRFSRPDLVVFDLDDTLYDYQPCHRAGLRALESFLAEEADLGPADVRGAWSEARAAVKDRLGAVAASHSRLLYAHEMISALGLGLQPELALGAEHEYWRDYLAAAGLRPGARELLSALRYEGIQTAVVTDLTLQIQLRKLVHLGLDRLIDHVVASEEAGGDKSTLRPFVLLCERFHVAPSSHVWFVGDSTVDVDCIAPLAASGRIAGGTGWLLGGGPSGEEDAVRRWQNMSEIRAALVASLGSRQVDRRLGDLESAGVPAVGR